MASTIILKLHYRGVDKPAPLWLRRGLFKLAAPLICRSVAAWSLTHSKCNHHGRLAKRRRRCDVSKVKVNGECRHAAADEFQCLDRKTALSETGSLDTVIRKRSHDNSFEARVTLVANNGHCDIADEGFLAEEWRKMAEVLDRCLFWFFLLFLMIPLLSMFGFIKLAVKSDED